jgi:hypothetical protein
LRHAPDPNYRHEVTGDKAIVPLGLKTTFNQGVTADRAAVSLLDEQGKLVGPSAN